MSMSARKHIVTSYSGRGAAYRLISGAPIRLLLAAFIIQLVAACSFAADLSPVPTDSWLNRELDWLLLNPPTDETFQISSRPYLRADIAGLLSVDNVTGNRAMDWRLNKLRAEMKERYIIMSGAETGFTIRSKISPYSIVSFSDSMRPLYRTGLKDEIAIMPAKNVTLYVRGRLENKGERDSFFKGRKWKKNLTGYFDYGLLVYRTGGLTVQYGRTFRVWGAGDTDRLLLSDNSPALDQLFAQYRYKRFMFQTFISRLDDLKAAPDSLVERYLAGHRISFKPRKNLEIGLSETVLHGRQSGPDWTYLNPFLPYYWEQFNVRKNDNVYMGADFVWWPYAGTRLYGELLIDDFQIDFKSEPHQVGFDIGISRIGVLGQDRLRLDAQYTQIRNYVYGQARRQNIFTNSGIVIGSSLGPDADRTRCKVSYSLTSDITLLAGGSFWRKGEGRASDPQPSAVPKGEPFPSGVVQQASTIYLGMSLLGGTVLDLEVEAGLYRIDNLANEPGRHESPYVDINIQYSLQRWAIL